MNPNDLVALQTYANPNPVPAGTMELYREYVAAWNKKSGGASVHQSVLPLLFVCGRKLDELRAQIADATDGARRAATFEPEPTKRKRNISEERKEQLRANLAKGRETIRKNRESVTANV